MIVPKANTLENHYWHERLYGVPERFAKAQVPREELIEWAAHRVADSLEFGEYLYLLIGSAPDGIPPFIGDVSWFRLCFENGWLPKPRQFPVTYARDSLVIVNGHTPERFREWCETKKGNKGISYHSYVRWLTSHYHVQIAPTMRQSDRSRQAMRIRSHRSSAR